MLFNSLRYLAFLPAVVAVYYWAPSRARLWVLLGASYLFYASWDAHFLASIWALTALNYALGLALERWRHHTATATLLVVLGVGIDLAALGYYKYSAFFLHNVQFALERIGMDAPMRIPSIILPLALSFFTFEFIHYLVDIRSGQAVVRSPLKFALFACFFPTQIAGPIKRFEQFVPQLERTVRWNWSAVGSGLGLVAVGFFKKSALADNLAPLVASGFQRVDAGQVLAAPDAWLVVLAFAMQIYFDFSGYTDMGRGSARILGFDVPENFRRPYLAQNLSEFWRRWHMSLSTWLRDYVYIALGGNRRRQLRNVLVTMLLGGLWHGANWTFVIWGALHGIALSGYWLVRTRRGPQMDNRSPALLAWLLTFVLVCVGWVFFRAPTLSAAVAMLQSMLGLTGAGAHVLSTVQATVIFVVVVGTLGVEYAQERLELRGTMAVSPELKALGVAALLVLTALLMPSSGPRFIYFQF